jgi:hypothetical protein
MIAMNKTEWMVSNPCNDCDDGFKEVREPYYDFGNECRCNDQSKYYFGIYSQKKLLGYLRDVALITPEAYQSPKSIIIKMIEQMEENNG